MTSIIESLKKIARDAITADTDSFPWIKPDAPTARSSTSSGFVESVTDADLDAVYDRNQAAHAIVFDVTVDAFTKFTCTDGKENELEKFNAEVQVLFTKLISKSLIRALFSTRLYGHSGVLIGYADGKPMSTPVKGTPKIKYLQVIPKPWIDDIILKTNKAGGLLLPPELDHYTINTDNVPQNIDASRLVHLRRPGLKEESLEGESTLLCIYDDLIILKNMSWGFGQAAWRHGGGLTSFVAPDSADPQAQIDAIDALVSNINAMTVLTLPPGTQKLPEYSSSLNPKDYIDTALQLISIGSRIPVSILRGSVAGSLTASEKDRKDYFELLDNIQKEILTPALMDILKRFQASGQLPQQEFMIKWDRTPIWMMEEQKSKLFVAQTELAEAKTKTETNIARKTYLEYKEMRKQMDKPVVDAIPHPGVIVASPHGELIWRGIQKAIVRSVSIDSHTNEPLYLISDGLCYGVMMLNTEEILDAKEFQSRASTHLMADDASLKRKEKLYYYSVKLLSLFERPRACEVTDGSRNYSKKVTFVKE